MRKQTYSSPETQSFWFHNDLGFPTLRLVSAAGQRAVWVLIVDLLPPTALIWLQFEEKYVCNDKELQTYLKETLFGWK